MNYEFNEVAWTRVKELKKGKVYFVCTKDAIPPVGNNFGIYPWGLKDFKVPVKVIAETRHFYVVEVLPHLNKMLSWGTSKPYRVTIDKFDLNSEVFRAWEETA